MRMKKMIELCLNSIVYLIYKIYRLLTRSNKIINRKSIIEKYYKSELIIEVNPRNITHYLPVHEQINGLYNKRCEKVFLCDGKWKDSIKPINEHRKTQAMYELFNANGNFREINAYKRHIFELKNNKLKTKNEPLSEMLDSEYTIEQYYMKNYKLYKTIKNKGFKSQYKENKDLRNEVGIAIDEDGTIYRYGNGYHRMAIAKYLKLKNIPVVVKLVHKNFYSKYREKYNADSIKSILIAIESKSK